MPHPPPIERFLGHVDPATGPFGVLGLPVRDATPEEIDAALSRRIALLERHRQGSSAEADEVLLALHVAAAQLRDTTVRRAMLAQLPGASRASAAPVAVERDVPVPPMGFSELARATIAHSGGWNRRSRRRIAGLAHTYGVSPSALRGAIADIAATQRTGTGPAVDPPGEPERATEAHDPERAPRWLVISTIGLFLCAAILVVALIAIVVSRLPGAAPTAKLVPAPPVGEAPGAIGASEIVEPTDRLSSSEAPAARGQDLSDALAALRRAGSLLADRPSEAERAAGAAMALFASGWDTGDPEIVEAGVAELSSFLTTAVRTDSAVAARFADRIIELSAPATGAPGPSLSERVFAAGAAARLSRDTLTGSIESRFREALVRMAGDGVGVRTKSFGAGAALALVVAARGCEGCPPMGRIAPEWMRVQAALAGIDAEAAGAALVESLGELLRAPFSRESSDGIQALAPGLALDVPGSRDAIRVIGWFDDREISTASLSALTSALLSSGAIPGAPLDVLVSASATDGDRARVRDALAARFGVPITAPTRRVADRIGAAAAGVLGATIPKEPIDALRLAARAAAVHQAASLKWVGRDADADAAIALAEDSALGAMVDSASQALGARLDLARLTGPTSGADGRWALRFIQASRNEDERARLLLEIRSGSVPIGPADADVLALAALGPNPPLLRKTAQRTLLMHALNPFVIAAVTEAIPDAVTTDDVAETLEAFTLTTLPDPRAETFRAAAARAVMARLLSAIAPSIDRRLVALQDRITGAYEGIADASADPLSRGVGSWRDRSDRSAGVAAAEAVRASLRRDAHRYAEGRWTFVRLSEIDRRHAARAALPRTGLERFIVEQQSIAETLAYLVAAERPLASIEAAGVIADMERAHLAAKDPMHQVLAAERAIVALWTIRFGTDAAAATPEGAS